MTTSPSVRGLTLGVLGVGRIGRMHAAHLAMHSDVKSVVLLGRDHERLKASVEGIVQIAARSRLFGAEPHAIVQKLVPRVMDPYRQRLDDYHGVDGLVITASTSSHREVVARALDAGVPLLIEKPLAPTVGEQEDLIGLLNDAGVPCIIGYHRRFDDDHRRLRDQLTSGELGAARGAVAVSLDYWDAEESYVPSSGGLWRDLAIHDFNALAWVLNDYVVSVTAHSAVLENSMYRQYGDVDTASATLTFSSGVLATILCGRNMGWRQETRLEVHGTAGSGSTDNIQPGSRTHVVEGAEEKSTSFTSSIDRFKQAYLNEADEFVKLVQGTSAATSPPAQCLAALKVALAAEESARTGHTVRIV